MRILFGTDGSRGATIAEEFLLELPLSLADEVIVVTAAAASERDAYALLSRSHWRFTSRGIPAATMLRTGHAAAVVADAAFERAPDLVVVGSRGLGIFTGALMGSVARDLVRAAPAPVLVVRGRREPPRHAVLAIDDSPEARAAIELTAQLPLPCEARFTLLHVRAGDDDLAAGIDRPSAATRRALREAREREGMRVLAHARDMLGERIADEAVLDGGHIGDQLLRHAIHAGAELVVIATRGQTHGSGVLGASLADHVLDGAHCAVLVARPRFAPRTVAHAAVHAFSTN